MITRYSSQHKMNGPLWSMSWMCWGHSDIGLCGCRRGIQSHCITLSPCTMTCWIIWMAWCKLWPRRRLNGIKTSFLQWSSLDRRCLNITLKWLNWQACFSLLHISLTISGSWDCSESGTMECISILRMRQPSQPNTKRPFWSMSRMDTV